MVSNVISVSVETPPVSNTDNRTVASAKVGIALGALAQGLSPDGFLQGAAGEISVTGLGLDTITAVSVTPATGLGLGAPVSGEGGTRLTIPLTVAADAPLVTRRLRLYAAGNVELAFSDPNTALFGIGSLPTAMSSVSPIILQQGKTATLTVRGSNLKSVNALIFEPPTGLNAYAGAAWSQDGFGELLTVPVTVDAAAPLGNRVIRLQVPGGSTSATANPANTLTVVVPQ